MGSIIAIVPIASFIGKLILGYTADYYLEWRKAIFMALFAMTGASYFLMYFLPPLPGPILPDHEFQNVSWDSLLPCDTNHVSFYFLVIVSFLDKKYKINFL